MKITVKYFGLLADLTQKREEVFSFQDQINSIQTLQSELEKLYPKMASTTYSFALNQKMANQNEKLHDGDEVALLPPFAGG